LHFSETLAVLPCAIGKLKNLSFTLAGYFSNALELKVLL